MNKKELLEKCKPYNDQKLIGIYIIQERLLHDSSFRIMNVIGHSNYDEKIKDFHYYLLSTCSDVICFNNYINMIPMKDLHVDINKHGIIHIWSSLHENFICSWTNCSSCILKKVDDVSHV